MKGALKIATAFNIPVYVHWSFGLIVGYVLYESVSNNEGFIASILSIFILFCIFFCIFLHELGHSFAGKKFNIETQDIVIYPIGGIVRLHEVPSKPKHEIIIALAGPLVNLLVFLILSPYFIFHSINEVIETTYNIPTINSIIPYLIIFNFGLFIINILPAFPMDGGRALRGLLSMKLDRFKATLTTVRIGQFFGLIFIYLGVIEEGFGFTLAILGFFVIIMANNEYKSVKIENIFSTTKITQILRKEYTRFHPKDSVSLAANEMSKGKEHSFLIFNERDILIGILEEKNIKKALTEARSSAEIDLFISPKIVAVEPQMSIGQAYYAFSEDISILPVMEGNEVVGVVDARGMNVFMKENGVR